MGNAVNEVLNMPEIDRIEVALKIWSSISKKEKLVSISDAQGLELEKRYKEFKSGSDKGISWKDAKDRLNKNLGR